MYRSLKVPIFRPRDGHVFIAGTVPHLSYYGAVNAGDVKIDGALGDTSMDTLLVDGIALNDVYSTFGSSAQTPTSPPIYRVGFDWNLNGNVDGVDLTHLYSNFGTIWKV